LNLRPADYEPNGRHRKLSASVAIYAALLWAFDLLADVHSLADPARDQEGLILSRSKARVRARRGEALDNDF
jgi:hypothetical protein